MQAKMSRASVGRSRIPRLVALPLVVVGLLLGVPAGCAFGERLPSKPLVILEHQDLAPRVAILVKDLDLDVRIRPPEAMPYSANASAAIWLGVKFPPEKAIAAIVAARYYYKQLRYVALSDRLPNVPEPIHHQIFIGGSTETALRLGLLAWRDEDFAALEKAKSFDEIAKVVRGRYGNKPLLKPLGPE